MSFCVLFRVGRFAFFRGLRYDLDIGFLFVTLVKKRIFCGGLLCFLGVGFGVLGGGGGGFCW